MIKIGLIGCGGMGGCHADCYSAIDNAEIVAVADVRKEKADEFAAKYNCKAYYSGKELIENAEVDAFDICLPTYLHTEHAVMAMEKGRNVFIEKPVCLKREESELLLETSRKTGVKVMVGQVMRFWKEYTWLKDTIESGVYGKLTSAVFKRVSPMPTWGWENWFSDGTKSGSVALDLHIHDVDFMRFILGEPKSFISTATRDESGLIDHIFSAFDYDNDVKIMLEGGWGYPPAFPFSMEYRVKLQKATITYLPTDNCVVVYPLSGEPIKPEIKDEVIVASNGETNLATSSAHCNELRYFVDCVEKNLPIEEACLEEGIKSVLLAMDEMDKVGGVYLK